MASPLSTKPLRWIQLSRGVAAARPAAAGRRLVGMDDLLAGQDVGIGVGAQHPGPELLGPALQRRQRLGLDLEGAESPDQFAGLRVDLAQGHLAVGEGVAHRLLGQVDVGLGLPGQGRPGRAQAQRRARRQNMSPAHQNVKVAVLAALLDHDRHDPGVLVAVEDVLGGDLAARRRHRRRRVEQLRIAGDRLQALAALDRDAQAVLHQQRHPLGLHQRLVADVAQGDVDVDQPVLRRGLDLVDAGGPDAQRLEAVVGGGRLGEADEERGERGGGEFHRAVLGLRSPRPCRPPFSFAAPLRRAAGPARSSDEARPAPYENAPCSSRSAAWFAVLADSAM